MLNQRVDRGTGEAFRIGVVGPINDQGFPDNILTRDETQ